MSTALLVVTMRARSSPPRRECERVVYHHWPYVRRTLATGDTTPGYADVKITESQGAWMPNQGGNPDSGPGQRYPGSRGFRPIPDRLPLRRHLQNPLSRSPWSSNGNSAGKCDGRRAFGQVDVRGQRAIPFHDVARRRHQPSTDRRQRPCLPHAGASSMSPLEQNVAIFSTRNLSRSNWNATALPDDPRVA